MPQFLAVALSFPSVVYTVLLGVVMVYWVFVMVGAAHLNLLGEGAADGALDGAADGAADGAIAGAMKGALEGAADHVDGFGGGHDGVGDADVGGGDGAGAHAGGLAGMLASLHLRSAPATVVLSALVLFSWLFSVLGMQAANAWLPELGMGVARFAVFAFAPMLALPVTSLVIRPLAPIFTPKAVATKSGLVGKVCTVRTGTVTDRFGEATLEDGGAGFVLRVRIDVGDKKLSRGDQAIILGYDEDRQEFTIAPMDDVMGTSKGLKARG